MEGIRQIIALILGLIFSLFSHFAAPLSNAQVRAEAPHATVLFVGDMLFDRTVRTTMNEKGGDFIFSCIDPLLQREDLVVGNLEGPITPFASVSATSSPGDEFNYTFTFATATAPLLFTHNIRLVNIGNNHITNFGMSGVRSTTGYLSAAGVSYFGDPQGHTVATISIGGVKLAFINYNEFDPVYGATLAASKVRTEIALAWGRGYIPVVYAHWGQEYESATDAQKNLAHSFIDAGAEMVIGSHPHVVQESEVYRGKHIYYSLGNFVFDQYFSDAVMRGLTLQVTFSAGGVSQVREIPVTFGHDRRVCAVE